VFCCQIFIVLWVLLVICKKLVLGDTQSRLCSSQQCSHPFRFFLWTSHLLMRLHCLGSLVYLLSGFCHFGAAFLHYGRGFPLFHSIVASDYLGVWYPPQTRCRLVLASMYRTSFAYLALRVFPTCCHAWCPWAGKALSWCRCLSICLYVRQLGCHHALPMSMVRIWLGRI